MCSNRPIFILRGKDEGEKYKTGYIIINGNYKQYSFVVTYYKDIIEDPVRLVNETYLPYIRGMYMNNKNFDKIFSYNFSSIGNYTIYFDLDLSSLTSLEYMFGEIRKMTSIKFSPSFNTKNIENMDRMLYYCNLLNELDLSIFDISSVTSMDRMFYSCHILTSLDISIFNTSSYKYARFI